VKLNPVSGIAIVLGILILLVSLLANFLPFSTDPDKFGSLQIMGVLIGLLFILAGAWMARRDAKKG